MDASDKTMSEMLGILKSWMPWRSEPVTVSRDFWMPDQCCRVCYDCDSQFKVFNRRHHCRLCGRVFCSKCTANFIPAPFDGSRPAQEEREKVRVCNYCFKQQEGVIVPGNELQVRFVDISTPSEASFPSTRSSGTENNGNVAFCSVPCTDGHYEKASFDPAFRSSQSPLKDTNNGEETIIVPRISNHPVDDLEVPRQSHFEFCNRSDDEADGYGVYQSDSERHVPLENGYYCPIEFGEHGNNYRFDKVNAVEDACGLKSFCSSPLEGSFVLQNMEGARSPGNDSSEDVQYIVDECGASSKLYATVDAKNEPVDFENNGLLWLPPEPEDEEDEKETVTYDDYNERAAAGEWGYLCNSSSFGSGEHPTRDRSCEEHKNAVKNAVDGHFRALVSQLLHVENVLVAEDEGENSWLEIITALAWEAASLLKPDTSRGGGMDPGGYVKVKCIASGNPCESMVVKGVVCKKNVAHRRMTSKIEKPRVLILGGALEYQRVLNLLSSFDTLLQQEMDHLKMAVAKIDVHRPDVLLVEKSVSRFAQEYLLAKDISLVLNIKRPLLERIARCTGAQIVPSIDHLSSQMLGYCDVFHVKRYMEEHGCAANGGKRSAKTLMYFEGCPKPLGCTVLLRGANGDELKKVKHVVQYGVFAAYHLALETSFLADEGATLPELPLSTPIAVALPDKPLNIDRSISTVPGFTVPATDKSVSPQLANEPSRSNSLPILDLTSAVDSLPHQRFVDNLDIFVEDEMVVGIHDPSVVNESGSSKEEFPPLSDHHSILVSLSSRCVWKGTVCERSHLFRIKYYGSFDKPLGRFLRDHLFDQSYRCCSCEMPSEAHVHCYTHRQGTLTISVKKLPDFFLTGEREGKIWMWHRCLRCPRIDGFPPAIRRIVMSDAAWGLSFGKFLELSFSDHAAASRVASCGHSLHRDCLRFYGFGKMVACFRYAPIDVHSVILPPSKLDFNFGNQDWMQKEISEVLDRAELLYSEVLNALRQIEERRYAAAPAQTGLKPTESKLQIAELEGMLQREKADFEESFRQILNKNVKKGYAPVDILDINLLRRQLIFQSYLWDNRLVHANNAYDSFFQDDIESSLSAPESKVLAGFSSCDSLIMDEIIGGNSVFHGDDGKFEDPSKTDDQNAPLQNVSSGNEGHDSPSTSICDRPEATVRRALSEGQFPVVENLSDTLDAAWSGETQTIFGQVKKTGGEFPNLSSTNSMDLTTGEKLESACPNNLGETRCWLNKNINEKVDKVVEYIPVYISSFWDLELQSGARLFLSTSFNEAVIPVYYDEPTSIISYALISPEYHSQLSGDLEIESASSIPLSDSLNSQGFHSDDSTSESYRSLGSTEESILSMSGSRSSFVLDPLLYTKALHVRVSFCDQGPHGKVKYSIVCYYAKSFEALRRICCPSELDFVRSLSRCKKWGAQGGKSNVFFAKSLDDRFIIKQVTKTELESFIKFAPAYFKYLSESIGSGSPTSLAKILGIYQVSTKHLKGGKESKMDVLVMENLLFGKKVTRLYDLKGSSRARYNPDSSGTNKVLLDQNLIEAMPTSPIFVGNKAKRLLERAVWNDTSFLASVDVMDYSLLVGVDEEKHELILGIIDFMRQYTWDKHLETWVKASGILGGPKNTSPTVVSPKQYKKRFRKAMTMYFLMVPDQWSPPTIAPNKLQSDVENGHDDRAAE